MSEQAQRIIAQNKTTQEKTLDLGNCGLTAAARGFGLCLGGAVDFEQ